MKAKTLFIPLLLVLLVSCGGKISIVNNSYNPGSMPMSCTDYVLRARLDGGPEQIVNPGETYDFTDVSSGDHTISLAADCPFWNNLTTCHFHVEDGGTKTITVTTPAGSNYYLTVDCP